MDSGNLKGAGHSHVAEVKAIENGYWLPNWGDCLIDGGLIRV